MYKKANKGQLIISELEDFILPFLGKLNPKNRWIILSKIIPWDKIEEKYSKIFSKDGAPAKSVRIALGALIIKERLNLSDRDTVEQIMENPYLQYFIGKKAFDSDKEPFDASMMVHFRKRFDEKIMMEINEMIAKIVVEEATDENTKDDKTDKGQGTGKQLSLLENSSLEKEEENKGSVLLDATCTPADISYPTDLNLLDEGREKTEKIIDDLHKEIKTIDKNYKKPRTYRENGRKEYLKVARSKKPGKKVIRRAIRKQLSFLGRNIKTINQMLDTLKELRPVDPFPLTHRQMKNYWVIQTMYEQQQEMYKENKHTIEDRIVSISQPHVRPIVRGKKNAETEFGSKVSISIVDGITYVEELSWNNYNEGLTLKASVEKYKERFGFYPKAVIADKIYRNRDNIKHCKELNIRLSGPALGRPNLTTAKIDKKQAYEDSRIRNSVEGKFGEGKRFYGLGRIMSKLKSTAETEILLQFVVMNLERKLRILFCKILEMVFSCTIIRRKIFYLRLFS
jgi:transposase, IS5 family